MRLRAGEVVERGPEALVGHDAQVGLHSALELDGALGLATGDGLAGPGEGIHDRGGVVGTDEEVEVSNGVLPPAVRARGLHAPQPGDLPEEAQDLVHDGLGPGEQEPAAPRPVVHDGLEQLLLRGLAHPRKLAHFAGQCRRLQVGDCPDAQLLMEEMHLLRSDALEMEKLEEGPGKLGEDLLVLSAGARAADLDDLLGDPLADALDPAQAFRLGAQRLDLEG